MINTGGRWNSGRTKERNRARYLIRERILDSQQASHVDNTTVNEQHQTATDTTSTTTDVNNHEVSHTNEQSSSTLRPFLKAVATGSVSTFSLKVLHSSYTILSQPFSTTQWSTYKIQTLCTSRFGKDYANAMLRYKDCRTSSTIMEYASLLGEYDIVGTLLRHGGINPFYVNVEHIDSSTTNNISTKSQQICQRQLDVSNQIMKRFMIHLMPQSLAVYIIKSIYEMKMWGCVGEMNIDRGEGVGTSLPHLHSDVTKCPICSIEMEMERSKTDEISPMATKVAQVRLPCHHLVCELCMWNDVLTHLDDRVDIDVIQCPLCTVAATEAEDLSEKRHSLENLRLCEQERIAKYEASLQKFKALPPSIYELKKLPKPSKIPKNTIHSSWSSALAQPHVVGRTQTTRQEKLFRYIHIGAIHHIRACLQLGVHVDMVNEYNQTPLYIASWRKYSGIVKLLLEYGADSKVLYHKQYEYEKECIDHDTSLQLQVLIPITMDHPGAGAFIIDNAVSQSTLSVLKDLSESIAPVTNDETKCKKKKNKVDSAIDGISLCSQRSYFCDVEGCIVKALEENIANTINATSELQVDNKKSSIYNVTCFPHMRFLNYSQRGGELAPHIDLSKTDILSKKRSSHTFILYLTDCKEGGETALLKELSPDGPDAQHASLALITPRRCRLLVFKHTTPHRGLKVISTPKVLLRGELLIEKVSDVL